MRPDCILLLPQTAYLSLLSAHTAPTRDETPSETGLAHNDCLSENASVSRVDVPPVSAACELISSHISHLSSVFAVVGLRSICTYHSIFPLPPHSPFPPTVARLPPTLRSRDRALLKAYSSSSALLRAPRRQSSDLPSNTVPAI